MEPMVGEAILNVIPVVLKMFFKCVYEASGADSPNRQMGALTPANPVYAKTLWYFPWS